MAKSTGSQKRPAQAEHVDMPRAKEAASSSRSCYAAPASSNAEAVAWSRAARTLGDQPQGVAQNDLEADRRRLQKTETDTKVCTAKTAPSQPPHAEALAHGSAFLLEKGALQHPGARRRTTGDEAAARAQPRSPSPTYFRDYETKIAGTPPPFTPPTTLPTPAPAAAEATPPPTPLLLSEADNQMSEGGGAISRYILGGLGPTGDANFQDVDFRDPSEAPPAEDTWWHQDSLQRSVNKQTLEQRRMMAKKKRSEDSKRKREPSGDDNKDVGGTRPSYISEMAALLIAGSFVDPPKDSSADPIVLSETLSLLPGCANKEYITGYSSQGPKYWARVRDDEVPGGCKHFEKLFSEFPDETVAYHNGFVPDLTGISFKEQCSILLKMLTWTKGEVMEFVPNQSSFWNLVKGEEPKWEVNQSNHTHIQFHCREPAHGSAQQQESLSENAQWECGRSIEPMTNVIPAQGPAWARQWNRLTCSCWDYPSMHWERTVIGISLGHLMAFLGSQFTAKQIFEYYSLCRLVAVKYKRDTKQCDYFVGTARLRAKMDVSPSLHNRWRVFHEACGVLNITNMVFDSPEGQQLVRDSFAQIAATVMDQTLVPWRAMGPPLGAGRTGAVGMEVGWQISRVLLLKWMSQDVMLFGKGSGLLEKLFAAVNGEDLAGCVGVPQYNCQGSKRFINRDGQHEEDGDNTMDLDTDPDGSMVIMPCGNTAEMTTEGQNTGGSHAQWLCKKCKEQERLPIKGASRIIHLYPLMRGTTSHATLVVINAVDLILYPPPEEWIWPHPKAAEDESTRVPKDLGHISKFHVKVNAKSVLRVIFGREESDDIWKAASNYNPPSSQYHRMIHPNGN